MAGLAGEDVAEGKEEGQAMSEGCCDGSARIWARGRALGSIQVSVLDHR